MHHLSLLRDLEPAASVSSTILGACLEVEAENRAREAAHRRESRRRELDALIQRRLQRANSSSKEIGASTKTRTPERPRPAAAPVDPRGRCGFERAIGAVADQLGRKIELERRLRAALEEKIGLEVKLIEQATHAPMSPQRSAQ